MYLELQTVTFPHYKHVGWFHLKIQCELLESWQRWQGLGERLNAEESQWFFFQMENDYVYSKYSTLQRKWCAIDADELVIHYSMSGTSSMLHANGAAKELTQVLEWVVLSELTHLL